MHYWNAQNFEGLKAIGEEYSARAGYELFGRYCLLKEAGLKKQAVSVIKEYVDLIKNEPVGRQRELVVELASIGFWNSAVHQLIAHPLEQFLKEVLSHWVIDEPHNAVPHKWLGYICNDLSAYRRALEIEPTDEICLTRIAQAYLKDVDFQTHHLSESKFIGKLDEAKRSIDCAEELIGRLLSQNLKHGLYEELNYFKRLIRSWEDYRGSMPEMAFPDFCASRGEEYNFWSVVYYG